MATIINASVSQGLVMTSDLSGVLTLQQNGVSLPNGGVAPAFSAYASSTTNLSNGTNTKIQFQTEEFDTNNNFDSTTNYRFTPTVAGYYQVNATVNIVGSTGNNYIVYIYKNGTSFKRGNQSGVNVANNNGVVASAIIYMNGSTDYLEVYGYQASGGSTTIQTGVEFTYFQACLVRGA